MAKKIVCIDLGTANTIVFFDGQIIFESPSVIATSKNGGLVAIGLEASQLYGKTSSDIKVDKPIRGGVISSFKTTELFLKYCISIIQKSRFTTLDAIVSVPAGLTSVEERAVKVALKNAGISDVYLLPEPVAAVLGAGIPIHSTSSNMIINIGGGTAEIATVSLGMMNSFKSEKTAGEVVTTAILKYARKNFGLTISEQTAEHIKTTIGSCLYLTKPISLDIRGRDSITGDPVTLNVSTNDFVETIQNSLMPVAIAAQSLLESVPSEVASDVLDRGVLLSGGSANLKNIDMFFATVLKIPTHITEDPIHAVIRGLIIASENMPMMSRCFK